jgi:hypothetical protein
MKSMVYKVISGGQTGVDIAALRVAKKLGFQTGGHMPKGYVTQAGCKPEYAKLYRMTELESPGYPARTAVNVRESDATLALVTDFSSPGEKLTKSLAERMKKPILQVDLNNPVSIAAVVAWVIRNRVTILNVAGNSEKTSPGISDVATLYLTLVLQELR